MDCLRIWVLNGAIKERLGRTQQDSDEWAQADGSVYEGGADEKMEAELERETFQVW